MLQVIKNEYQHGRGTFDVIRFNGRVIAEKHNGSLHCSAVSKEMAATMLKQGLKVTEFEGVSFLNWNLAKNLIEE